jgi:putative membrane protein
VTRGFEPESDKRKTVPSLSTHMQQQVKNNVPAVTGLLSIISLALVFGAAMRVIPASVLPHIDPLITIIPHLNAVISLVAIGTISAGWYFIKKGAVRKHRIAMLTSFVLFAVFLTLYLYRVILVGPSHFPGPATIKMYFYLPLLAIHILLAIVCVPLLYYVLLLAATRPVSEIYSTNHRRVARIAAPLWLISFTLGVVVYVLLYIVY